MSDYKQRLREDLVRCIEDHYLSCPNPKKSEKCITFDDPHDIPCASRRTIEIRRQIYLLDKDED